MDASNNPIYGKNDLFAIVIIFKLMLSKKAFNSFISSLSLLFDDLSREIKTITINDVLREMGFPSNWKDIKLL